MRFHHDNGKYSCSIQSCGGSCYLALEFSEQMTQTGMVMYRDWYSGQRKTQKRHLTIFGWPRPPEDRPTPYEQVGLAVTEKEREYNRRFFVKTTRFYENDLLQNLEERTYYRFAGLIIDRLMLFPDDYDG